MRSGTPCAMTRTAWSIVATTLAMYAPNPFTTVPSSTTSSWRWSATTAASVSSSYGLRYRQFTTVTESPSAASSAAAASDGSTMVPTARIATSPGVPWRSTSQVRYGTAAISPIAGGTSGAASRG